MPDDLWNRFSYLARDMSQSPDLASTLGVAVEGATALVAGAEAAGISMVHHGRSIDTPAASYERCRCGDALQYELGQGPCLQAIHQQETVRSRDLRTEELESGQSVVASRIALGQAQGMLMQRYRLAPERAFAVLAREAHASGRRLRDVADDIVRNGVIEGHWADDD